MKINDIIKENEDLRRRYIKAKESIAKLERRLEKLEEEIKVLKEQNEKLRKQNATFRRAIEIALSIPNREKQELHLKAVLAKLRETGEFKG